jgi:hypothetical protein
VYCFVDIAFGMYFPKSLKSEISVFYMLHAPSARTHTNAHTECEEVGMVKSSGKFILNEFINQIRKQQQKYSARIIKNDN